MREGQYFYESNGGSQHWRTLVGLARGRKFHRFSFDGLPYYVVYGQKPD